MQTLVYAMFVIATPVQFWAGRQFYRGTLLAARHGARVTADYALHECLGRFQWRNNSLAMTSR